MAAARSDNHQRRLMSREATDVVKSLYLPRRRISVFPQLRLCFRPAFAVIAFLLCVWVARAAERHREFLEGLRSRGLHELALEYLQRIAPNPPPELQGRVPLEIAKTR